MAVFITRAAADDFKFDLMQEERLREADGFQRRASDLRMFIAQLDEAISLSMAGGDDEHVELDADLADLSAEFGYCG